MAGPRGSGRDLPALWAPRSEPAEPSGAGHLRGAPRIGAVRVARRLREALGYAPGFAAQAWPSPGGGLRKGQRGQRGQEGSACRPQGLTGLEFVCAARILDWSLVDHVRHQQPRGGEEAAGEYAERFTGLVPGMQEEIPTCQRGKLWTALGEGTVSMSGPIRPSPSLPNSCPV